MRSVDEEVTFWKGINVGEKPAMTRMAGGGVSAVQQMATKLAMPDKTGYDVMLEYGNATTNYVWTPIDGGEYWARWPLVLQATGLWSYTASSIYSCLNPTNDTDVGITYVGTWASQAIGGPTFGGNWHLCQTVGTPLAQYAEFSVTPGVGGKIWVVVTKHNNAGIAQVTINGSTALCNELTGGVLDCYAAVQTNNVRVLIASGLDSSTSYTVRVARTETKNDLSSSYRVYFEGYGIAPLSLNTAAVLTTTNSRKSLIAQAFGGTSQELAYHYKPTGATNFDWTGSQHGAENITSVTWQDQDTTDITVSVGTPQNSGTQVIVTQDGTSRHSETGATDHANVQYIHTFSVDGMRVYHKHTFLSAGTCDAAHTAMFGLISAYSNSGYVGEDDSGSAFALTNDDDVYNGQLQKKLAVAWTSGEPWAAWLEIPDLTGVDNWTNSAPNNMSIQDRIDGVNKIYCSRVGVNKTPAVSFSISDEWEGTADYRISYYPDSTNLP